MTSQSTDSPYSGQSSGPVSVGSTDIPWLTFSGSPRESVSTFIQSVQRVAFHLNNMYEDGWIAHYAAGCLCDDSLLWYSNLDEETCNSWRKLRKALLQQYYRGYQNPEHSLTRPTPTSLDLPSPGGPLAPIQQAPPLSSDIPIKGKGIIEVFLNKCPGTVGFLAYDHDSSNFSVIQDSSQAQVVSFPTNPGATLFNILIEGLPDDTQYPYLGLMLEIKNAKQPYPLPPLVQKSKGENHYRIRPSAFCPGNDMHGSGMATWTLKACTESSSIPRYRRLAKALGAPGMASSAIWKYDLNTNQLSLTWMMDDETEEEIVALMPDVPEQGSLHFHRIRDWAAAGNNVSESQVKFYFVPKEAKY